MSNTIKYALAAGAGYALHAFLNREEKTKVYKPTPIDDETLVQKLVGTVISHGFERITGRTTPSTNSQHTYRPNFNHKE